MAAVQINLLEEKERKNRTPYLLIAGTVVLLILLGGTFWWQTWQTERDIVVLETTLQELSEEETRLNTANADIVDTQRQQLKEAIERLRRDFTSMPDLIREMVALLPERGYIEFFTVTENNTVTLDVRLDNLQDAAAYLNRLDSYERTAEVTLMEVTGEEVDARVDPFEYRVSYLATYQVELPGAVVPDEEEGEDANALLEP